MPRALFRTSRRQFLIAGAGGVAGMAFLPACGKSHGGVFSGEQRAAMGALGDWIFPADADPGATQLGLLEYVDRLVGAFDFSPPMIFAGGPFSGRQPYPNEHPSSLPIVPSDSFARFVPLDRVAEAAWRARIFGGSPNEKALGHHRGLIEVLRAGLDQAIAAAKPKTLAQMTTAEIRTLWNGLNAGFRDELTSIVHQACFAAPEYGGNKDLAGWRIIHFEGDSQPLGYSIWNPALNRYQERPEAPNSTANPGPDPDPLTDDVRALIDSAMTFLGGTKFY